MKFNWDGSKQHALGRMLLIGFFDVLSIFICFYLALWMRFEFRIGDIPPEYLKGWLISAPFWCAVSVVVFLLFKLYSSVWSFVSTDELFRIIGSYCVLGLLGLGVVLLNWVDMPRSYYALGYVLSFLCTVAIRFA